MQTPTSRDVAARFRQSNSFVLLEELGHELLWIDALVELCDAAEIDVARIDRAHVEHVLFEVLPAHHWVRPERAHDLATELRAFWMFSLFELDNPYAGAWADIVGLELAPRLAYALRRHAPTDYGASSRNASSSR